MSKPLTSDWETTRETLEWYEAYLIDNEPQAVAAIERIQGIMLDLPESSDELESPDA